MIVTIIDIDLWLLSQSIEGRNKNDLLCMYWITLTQTSGFETCNKRHSVGTLVETGVWTSQNNIHSSIQRYVQTQLRLNILAFKMIRINLFGFSGSMADRMGWMEKAEKHTQAVWAKREWEWCLPNVIFLESSILLYFDNVWNELYMEHSEYHRRATRTIRRAK